ncbi:group I intron-associated PD-(D/E)XK endonuclease [Thiosulfativibrio zosterae]|uniref:PD(D/E)XK endonuclease domain-containing protein n=1 Tax=Thiosulfativibrio zosterae TaxID=2675053 RepID=A0A6F8PR84_9GAMM|nr:group I intron-associated PD-(D/E)XK endonuclease [Thiosulfativibrio zosterae]BBP44544.1 hypothetical protein THMIRHAT_22900 [Thiosulfativibrio zosterae]
MKSYGESAEEILKTAGVKGMHVDDITNQIINNGQVFSDSEEEIKTKVTAYLSNKAGPVSKPKKNSTIRRVKGKKPGSYLRGVYRYYGRSESIVSNVTEDISETAFIGAAGEYAVASEFLFKGYNVSRPAVDSGIDLTVFKGNTFSNIQVKTSSSKSDKFQFSIRTKIFDIHSNISTYYVLLCRRQMRTFYRNDYVILPSTAIEFFVTNSYINRSQDSISLTVTIEPNNKAVLNGIHDITNYLNKFELK